MKPIVLKLGYGSSLPVLEPDKAEIIDLNHLQSLGNGIKDKLDPILRQLDREVVGQRVPVTVRDLHSLRMRYNLFFRFTKNIFPQICQEYIPQICQEYIFLIMFLWLFVCCYDQVCHFHSKLWCAKSISTLSVTNQFQFLILNLE